MHSDQLGNSFASKDYHRIVSLVPSQTELLFDLGLADRIVGITKFCVHPREWFDSKPRVGGTKTVDLKKVAALQPDLIIGNKEENEKDNIEALSTIAPVWMSDIYTLEDSLDMINRLGNLLKTKAKASILVNEIKYEFAQLLRLKTSKSCLYLIWRNPYMGAGSRTFIHHILTEQLGFKNCIEEETRYPEIEMEHFRKQPDCIFLSSEPYPFKQKHIDELKQFFPKSKLVLVDGEFFSWYGSRLKSAPRYFQELLNQLH